LRLPHFLDTWPTDGGAVVSLCGGHPLSQEDSWCSFLLRGHSVAGRIRSIEESSDLIGNRTHELPACSIVPEPTTLPHAPTVLSVEDPFTLHSNWIYPGKSSHSVYCCIGYIPVFLSRCRTAVACTEATNEGINSKFHSLLNYRTSCYSVQ
jgi:hypothetical protein